MEDENELLDEVNYLLQSSTALAGQAIRSKAEAKVEPREVKPTTIKPPAIKPPALTPAPVHVPVRAPVQAPVQVPVRAPVQAPVQALVPASIRMARRQSKPNIASKNQVRINGVKFEIVSDQSPKKPMTVRYCAIQFKTISEIAPSQLFKTSTNHKIPILKFIEKL